MSLLLFSAACGLFFTVAFFVWEWIEQRAYTAYQRRKGRKP